MKYAQEGYAKAVERALFERLVSADPSIAVVRKGAGVHWNCHVRCGQLSCRIHCFDLPRNGGPEYLTIFSKGEETVAYSRISSADSTIAAVGSWLRGEDIAALYEQYPFVDQRKRALLYLADQIISLWPDLGRSADFDFERKWDDIGVLRFKAAQRVVEFSFWGENQFPDAKFIWDGCELFRFSATDEKRLAKVMHQWLCENTMPSVLRQEHDWLTIDQLADYYEKGNPIEGEFVQSWNRIVEFYESSGMADSARIVSFLMKLRAAGFDKTLRAGQSLFTLVLSRSRRHGLRTDQPCLTVHFVNGTMGIGGIRVPVIDFTLEVETLLKKLELEPID